MASGNRALRAVPVEKAQVLLLRTRPHPFAASVARLCTVDADATISAETHTRARLFSNLPTKCGRSADMSVNECQQTYEYAAPQRAPRAMLASASCFKMKFPRMNLV